MLAIPYGKKCFAWFTEYDNKNVCIMMELSESKNKITNVSLVTACFSNDLVYGTILYGTLLYNSKTRFFTIEDIFYYKGDNVSRANWLDKFSIIGKLLKTDLKQISYNSSFVVFGLPVFSNNYDELIYKIQNLTYKISTIQFRMFNKINNYLYLPFHSVHSLHNNGSHSVVDNKNFTNVNYKNPSENEIKSSPTDNLHTTLPIKNTVIHKNINKDTNYNTREQVINPPTNRVISDKNNSRINHKREIVFQVKADIQNDIYHLFLQNEKGQLLFYDIASIPDYKTSVMMNNLFRNIKENNNLDALEESDDEEEFESENIDRFVNLNKVYNMVCGYNYKFKKWSPLKVADNNMKISTYTDIQIIR